MRKLQNSLMIMLITAVFSGCSPTAKDILKKYDANGDVSSDANKAGISLEVQDLLGAKILINYSSQLLDTNKEIIEKLSERWFVANAENPDVRLPVKFGIMTFNTIKNNVAQPVTYGQFINMDSIKARFLLIGFEGIGSTESKEAETKPLFFLVENNKSKSKVLTFNPRLAGKLFTAGYDPMFFYKQEYSGEIPFEKSKNVSLHFTLSADLKKVTKLGLSAEELHLLTTRQGISNVKFSGGFNYSDSIDIINNKITLNGPLFCELTVTNACIYGTIKVEIEGDTTKAVYAVFKNTTTPQEIPENILK